MADEQKPPEKGTGDQNQEPAWKKSGFESEAALLDAAKEASALRSKLADAETGLEKEQKSRQKTDADYLRQSNEVGDLRKQLKDLENRTASQKPPEKEKTDDEVLDSLSDDDIKAYDDLLAKPENAELKKAVVAGGKTAMAEFVRSYKKTAPVDMSKVSVFAVLKRKSDTVSKASIANMVKSLFEKNETENRNNLPAIPPAGSPADRAPTTKKVSPIGTVSADFFRKDKTQA